MTSDGEGRRAEARELLLADGARDLARGPWQHPNESPADEALVRFALWRTTGLSGAEGLAEVAAGLALIDSARSDLDTLETALVFTARAEGMTWAQIAEAMGLRSPQAAQQRFQRTSERPGAAASHRVNGGDHA